MRCALQTGLKRRQTQKLAMAVAVCFIVISLLSGAFILTHADHEHDHNGVHGTCASCAQLQNAENVIKILGMGVVGGFAVFAEYYAAFTLIRAIYSNIDTLTLITAKTRMNN